MQLILVVPHLFGEPGAPSAAPGHAAAPSRALARIAGSSTPARDPRGIECALLDACGVAGVSAAHATALARGEAEPRAAWLVADPVSLSLGIDDVRVAARVDDLDPAESAALQETLNAHFAADGLRFAGEGTRWLARLREPLLFEASPTSVALGQSLWSLRPRGRDARRIERFANEAQMLLHEHAVNRERAARGRVAVDGLWLWDALPASPPGESSRRRIDAFAAADGGLGELARGLARASGGHCAELPPGYEALVSGVTAMPAAGYAATPAAGDAVQVVVAAAAPFAALERDWLVPSLAALWRGTRRRRDALPARLPLSRLTLIGNDAHGVAQVFDALRPPLVRRLAMAFAPSRSTSP